LECWSDTAWDGPYRKVAASILVWTMAVLVKSVRVSD